MEAAQTLPSVADASRGLLQGRVLDAVGELAADRPWGDVKLADVADRAGVSRQTLYNNFGSRGELAQEYVLREAGAFATAVTDAVRSRADDPTDALRAALGIFLAAAETHPLIKAVTSEGSGEEFLPLVTTRGGPLVADVTAQLSGVVCETWPTLPRTEAQLVVDSLVRLAISHAALPAGTPSRTADEVARVLGPYVEELLAKHG